MKKIMFVALALLMGLASCVKDKQYPGITISNVKYTPTAVQDGDDVTVTATITSFNEFTAKLVYGHTDENGEMLDAPLVTVEMVTGAEKDVYSAVIPGFPDGTKVGFYVLAEGTLVAQSPEMEYTVGAVAVDYSVLRLNELNGNDKFIEIYNTSDEPINLNGVYIEKDGTQNWLADNTVKIDAGGYLLLYSEDVTIEGAAQAGYPESLTFHSGLSAKKNVRIQLFSPAGVSIDDFNLTNIDANDPAYIPAPASYSRNADGKWYYADATPGAVNVDGTVALLGLEGGDTPEPPTPEEPDYNNLVLNELNGQDHKKFIEIYNAGAVAINMEGVTIYKDTEKLVWTGKSGVNIEAGAYLLLFSEDVYLDYDMDTTFYMFHSGLSAKKNVRIELKSPTGECVGDFNLTNIDLNGEAYGYVSNQAPDSYSRNADGKWYYSEATPSAVNIDGENLVLGLEGR